MTGKNIFNIFVDIIESNDIDQILVSAGLSNYFTKLSKLINMNKYAYIDSKKNTLFIGMYRDKEYNVCMNHIGKKWIYWHKNDCSPKYKTRVTNVTSLTYTKIEANLYGDNETFHNLNHFRIISYDIFNYTNPNKPIDMIPTCSTKKQIFIVMPTYNRSENIEKSINMMSKQIHTDWFFLIIDDGSTSEHKIKFNTIKDKYKSNEKIKFIENPVNIHIGATLNVGINYLLIRDNFSHFTWISDDNDYYPNFLCDLYKDNCYFRYSLYDTIEINKIKGWNKKSYSNYTDLLYNFNGCASFMWTREAIKNIGYYMENIHGCEDYEYLLRTFKLNSDKCSYTDISTMLYVRHDESLYIKEKTAIQTLYNEIIHIYKYFNNMDANFIYYSKTDYDLLFQRPHQIMRFYNKLNNKCFIGHVNSVRYESKYNLLIVPYRLNKCVYNSLMNDNIITYFTDSRLYNDIIAKQGKKLFDLIDAPIDDFVVWKPNLEKCVKNSNYVIYSHPNLIEYLNKIDDTKQYHYISNACDYDYFCKSKDRIGERPVDFPETNKKILGYYGAFAKWLDYDLIESYANKNEYHLIMIGGIKGNTNYNIKFSHPNITWLDHKPYDEIAYYLSWFDVCFLPFKNCELISYVNPCKLWEYMASEKEILKFNVNISCDTVVKYKDVCIDIEKIYTKLEDMPDNIRQCTNYTLNSYNIKQLLVADCLSHLEQRFKKIYNLTGYNNSNLDTVYFGVYSVNDIDKIKTLKSPRYVIFGGSDVDLILGNIKLKKLFDKIFNVTIFHISDSLKKRLAFYGYKSIGLDLDLTYRSLFKKQTVLGDSVFIYNGKTKGQENVYGKDIYEQIVIANPQYEYIFSNELNVPYEEMPNIYKKCFIGLRLTSYDGNANMVKEMECMGIPVIHNHSSHGIKWNTVDNINRILHQYKNNNIIYDYIQND